LSTTYALLATSSVRHAQKQRITTCGSGHFLLGAFHRLHERWQRHAPGLGPRELVAKALDGVYGVDINPFAVAIARFRLLVAALRAAGDISIEENIGYRPHLAAGDSLLWGAPQQALDDDMLTLGATVRADATENAAGLKEILQRHHDVVVGNPPYITPKDAALNATYRELYRTCHRKYALTTPFMELLFSLAYPSGNERPSGWVGQITSNAFMKREFGSKLVEDFLPTLDLRAVIDTSGAYIPGHGTPTVIVIGRNQSPSTESVRAVLGVRGEPGRPDEPAKGLVWSAIVEHFTEPGFENPFISVADLPRTAFQRHPWSLSGGGAVELSHAISNRSATPLGALVKRIGFFGVMGADDAFTIPIAEFCADRFDSTAYPSLVEGLNVRDFAVVPESVAFFPYDADHRLLPLECFPHEAQRLWTFRTELGNRATFSRGTYFSDGRPWYEWHQLPLDADVSPLSITFAEVATHNHFVLDRGGKVFKQTAPVIKLPAGASVEDHLRLLGVLNSSVVCFWLKQKCHNKGSTVDSAGARTTLDAWENFYQINGTTLKDFPLPSETPLDLAEVLDSQAQALQQRTPGAVAADQVPTASTLEAARAEYDRLRALMIAYQEELDWQYYRIYGLIDEDLTFDGEVPGIALGERAFEIALARKMQTGEETTAWFDRHGSTPITDIPAHLPADYRDLIQRRLDAIASNPNIRLLERPEYKRRWAVEPWDKQVESALRGWLLDRVEERTLWFDRDGRPTPMSVGQLADILDRDADFREVLRLWAGDPNAATGAALAKLLADEAVPFLAAYRYKPSGLDKRADWEHTWALQRREDAGEKLDSPIPVPPKYKSADFVKPSYWSHRGKLDVPKERFISYPAAGRDSDPTELLGWAGWDHAEQALALAGLVSARIEDGWDTPRLVPLLAGLHELAPWVRQWHNEIDPEYGESVADTIDEELAARLAEHHLTVIDLTAWRPAAPTRGRRASTR